MLQVRSSKLAKHSKYAPADGNRYDGIYKVGKIKLFICMTRYCLTTPSSGMYKILKYPAICWYVVKNEVIFNSDSYSACVVCTKTIIYLSVSESGGY